ncbi:MAG: CDP-alcohol phosphatidyltransferase family protein [Planctomycetes bacterium]|nr:CDP-alcohol phosphatidyltransferase family protein [Planctomycetota bacterium]
MRLTAANQITLLRIILIIPFVLCMVEANHSSFYRYAALGIFVVMAVSDAVDGYLARVKKQATRLGAFLDPMADKLLITCACILLASQRFAVPGFQLPLEVVILILGKDALLCLGFMTFYFLTDHVRIAPVWVGKLATFLQLVMVASILIAPEMTQWLSGWAIWVPICWWSAGVAAILAVTIYIHDGLRYISQFEQQQNRQEDAEKEKTGKK